jgi:two-component sensor histidine kinase
MAAAQRVLYGRSDASRFNADELLQAVCQTVEPMLANNVRIACDSAPIELSNDIAIPLALIVNELMTNAVKHGVKDKLKGTVHVRLDKADGQVELFVEDDGEGFDLDAVRRTSSGLQLVSGLARQLRGTFEVTRGPSRASLRFPVSGATRVHGRALILGRKSPSHGPRSFGATFFAARGFEEIRGQVWPGAGARRGG